MPWHRRSQGLFELNSPQPRGGFTCPDAELGIRFRGNPCSIEQSKSEGKFLGLSVHHKFMEKMIKNNENLPFTVSFSFSEKREREPEGLDEF